jgi:hypothetical protein
MREALVKVGEEIRNTMENEKVGAMANRHPESLDES